MTETTPTTRIRWWQTTKLACPQCKRIGVTVTPVRGRTEYKCSDCSFHLVVTKH